ncbi:hemerythrin domain-containing protein [Actinomadura gamaensis]|uniref:Hemerythrin domain-containing protein n=1 Tax=Actinomadura gamaensis TaxID=1763541 RepID=A0ABV9TZE1_9ACTN
MPQLDFPGANPQGVELAQRLFVIHDQMRRDMDEFRRLVTAVVDGIGGDAAARGRLQGAMDAFRQRDWQRILPRYCAQFCSFVHGHHTVEDASMFPVLQKRNPDLAPRIKQLVEEHGRLVEHLDQLQQMIRLLPGDPSLGPKMLAKVGEVAELLSAHLEYEETHLTPTLVRLTYADIA